MCWACYTPLTGAATASAAGAAPRAAAAPVRASQSEEVKKPVSPGLVGLVAFVLLIGLAVGLKTIFAGSQDMDYGTDELVIKDDEKDVVNPPRSNNPPPGVVPPLPPLPPVGGVPLPQTQSQPSGTGFQITAMPNPRMAWGTMAIVPTEANLGESQAAALAQFTLTRFSNTQMKRWNRFYIYVFKDRQTAEIFNNYMRGRRGARLTAADYQALSNIWPNTLVRYEYRKQHRYVVYPSKNIGGWWLEGSDGRS